MRIDKLGNDEVFKSFSAQNFSKNAQINCIFDVKTTGAPDETKSAPETNFELNGPNPDDPKKIASNIKSIIKPERKGDLPFQGLNGAQDGMAALIAMNGSNQIPSKNFGNSVQKFIENNKNVSADGNNAVYFRNMMFTKDTDGKDYVIFYNDKNTVIQDKNIISTEFSKGGYLSFVGGVNDYQLNNHPGLASNWAEKGDAKGMTLYNGTSSTKNDGTANQSKVSTEHTNGNPFSVKNIIIAEGDIKSDNNKTVLKVPLEQLIPNYKENGEKYIKEHQ